MSGGTAWIEAIAAGLLVLSGVFVLVSAVGFARLPDFFLRMHPPALAYTMGSWCVALSATLYFSFLEKRAALHPLLIPVLLSITVPVTTVLLARLSLFRGRTAGDGNVPPSLARPGAPRSMPDKKR
ncbi:Na+/H+ antiporter subunit G [Tahibacter sp. UC22_41]|uniref:Na+/H+ antiporter subunit G n=1 Tax=Tahibacter sp. UC22_41 TaxID=3350178 RepID=UPI0036DA5CF3